ncbi:hypothetical protein BDN70DRAFT_929408 [Pholiota conissans]|uniref:Uncharacterized protein n=1 Tax=Pholiota conissans TaxID=109636 RepID=A0A9P5Z7W2_9AGAR|nr:hypothetical protein BDN70DRAFT_929408 [Pholiota conissans]
MFTEFISTMGPFSTSAGVPEPERRYFAPLAHVPMRISTSSSLSGALGDCEPPRLQPVASVSPLISSMPAVPPLAPVNQAHQSGGPQPQSIQYITFATVQQPAEHPSESRGKSESGEQVHPPVDVNTRLHTAHSTEKKDDAVQWEADSDRRIVSATLQPSLARTPIVSTSAHHLPSACVPLEKPLKRKASLRPLLAPECLEDSWPRSPQSYVPSIDDSALDDKPYYPPISPYRGGRRAAALNDEQKKMVPTYKGRLVGDVDRIQHHRPSQGQGCSPILADRMPRDPLAEAEFIGLGTLIPSQQRELTDQNLKFDSATRAVKRRRPSSDEEENEESHPPRGQRRKMM